MWPRTLARYELSSARQCIRRFTTHLERKHQSNKRLDDVSVDKAEVPAWKRRLERDRVQSEIKSRTRDLRSKDQQQRELQEMRDKKVNSRQLRETLQQIRDLNVVEKIFELALGQKNNIVVFTTAIHRLTKLGHYQQAKLLFQKLESNFELDLVAYGAIINVCQKLGKVEACEKYFARAKKAGLEPNVVVITSMMRAYAKTSPDQAIDLFYTVPERERTQPCYSTAILAFKEAERWDEGWAAWEEMKRRGVHGGFPGISSILSLCTNAGWYDKTDELWDMLKAFARESNTRMNRISYATMVNSYAGRLDLVKLEALLREMEQNGLEQDSSNYNARIGCLWNMGRSEEALKLLRRGIDKRIFDLEYYSTARHQNDKVDLHELSKYSAAVAAAEILLRVREEHAGGSSDVLDYPLKFNYGSSKKFLRGSSGKLEVESPVRAELTKFLEKQQPPLSFDILKSQYGEECGIEITQNSLKSWVLASSPVVFIS